MPNFERLTQFTARSIQNPVRGFEYLYSRYAKKPLRRNAVTLYGERLQVVLPEGTSRILYMGDQWEPEVEAFMEYAIRPGMTVFDIGAHIGSHSLNAAYLVGEKGKVIAFEPAESVTNILRMNCLTHPHIIVVQTAVTDGTSSTITLHDYGIIASVYNTTDTPRIDKTSPRLAQEEVYDVSAVSIDQYVEQTRQIIPDFIKIDIENGDMAALRGASSTLKNFAPYLVIEGGDIGRSTENSTLSCLDFLTQFGYSFYVLDTEYQIIAPLDLRIRFDKTINIFCIPSGDKNRQKPNYLLLTERDK